MRKLHLSDDLSLPGDVIEDVTAIVGRRGRGKTNTATVLVEEAFGQGRRFVVLDPVGVWWGLRSSRDGKAAGIPAVVLGGEHPMAPLEPTAGQVVADFVVGSDVAGVVLDFRMMRKGEMTRFARTFLERLYQKNREPLLVVIDEADKFAPQRAMGEEAFTLGACEDVVKMGRARGLHAVLITQRPATLNKNVLTQAGTLIAHGLTAPLDRKAIAEWVHEQGEDERAAEVMATLPKLPRGAAWVWNPERELLRQVAVRARSTFDSSGNPGETKRRGPQVLAEVDLDKLSAEIRATAERAKADDPKVLRARIAELERQVKATTSAPAAAPARAVKPRLVDLPRPTLPKGVTVERIEALASKLAAAIGALAPVVAGAKAIEHADKVLSEFVFLYGNGAATPRGIVLTKASAPAAARGPKVIDTPPYLAPAVEAARPHVAAAINRAMGKAIEKMAEGAASTRMGRAFLTALAQRGAIAPLSMTKKRLLIVTGYRSSGPVSAMFAQLLREGLTETAPDGGLSITRAGRDALGEYKPLPKGRELREYLLETEPRMEAAMLRVLFDHYPQAVSKGAILEATGYKSSGPVSAAFAKLVAVGYAVQRGPSLLVAADELFEE